MPDYTTRSALAEAVRMLAPKAIDPVMTTGEPIVLLYAIAECHAALIHFGSQNTVPAGERVAMAAPLMATLPSLTAVADAHPTITDLYSAAEIIAATENAIRDGDSTLSLG